MKVTIENFEKKLKEKETKLFKALERQKNLFNNYAKDLYRKDGKTFENVHNFDFNLIHDLECRLIERIQETQSKYYSFHWDKYNFNAY